MPLHTVEEVGLYCLLRIALRNAQTRIRKEELQSEATCAATLLTQALDRLHRDRLVQGSVSHGYSLARPPAEITIWDTIAAFSDEASSLVGQLETHLAGQSGPGATEAH